MPKIEDIPYGVEFLAFTGKPARRVSCVKIKGGGPHGDDTILTGRYDGASGIFTHRLKPENVTPIELLNPVS